MSEAATRSAKTRPGRNGGPRQSGRQELLSLKERVDLRAFAAARYTIEFDSSGSGCCPYTERHNHGDRNPSLRLYKNRSIKCWSQQCFGEKGVDVFGLVKAMEDVGLAEARRIVAEYAGVKVGGNGIRRLSRAGMGREADSRVPAEEAGGSPTGTAQSVGASFEYHNGAGGVVYTIDRWEGGRRPKTFTARPSGTLPEDRVLYRHPELDPTQTSNAAWVDPWPEFLARATHVERLVCVIVQHLLKDRDAIFDTLDGSGWAWSRGTSRELDAVDYALERLGVHLGGGRQ